MGLMGTKGYCQRRLENNKIKYFLEKQNQKKKRRKVREIRNGGETCKNMGTVLRKLGKKKGVCSYGDLMTEIGKR